MKIATRALLPTLILVLAACGSGKTASSSTDRAAGAPADSAPAKAPGAAIAPTPEDKTTPRDKGASGSGSRSGSGSGSGSGAKNAAADRFSGLTKLSAARKSKRGGIALPHRSELGVTGRAVYPAAAVVGADAPFDLLLSSFDGKRHTVKLATPTPRTVIVPADAKHPAQVPFPALRAGVYYLRVDNKRLAELTVIDPNKTVPTGRITTKGQTSKGRR